MVANVSSNSTGRALPSDIQQSWVIAKYDVLKYLRSRRLLGILVIEALVLALITVLVSTADRPYTVDGVIEQYVGFTSIMIILGATLFGGDAIVSEYQGRTGYLLFPNPVKKSSIMAGKFVSSVAAMTLILLVYYAVTIVAAFILGDGSMSNRVFASLGLALLYGITALSVAFLISSVMKGSTGALILTFALFFLIFSIVTSLIGQLGGIKPWFMLDFAGSTLSYVMADPYPVDSTLSFEIAPGQAFTTYLFYPEIGLSIAVMAVYAVASIVLAYVFFRRREMSA
ncbi:MAG: ABC transporter permease subunit [Methanomassiliicoccus sp.]|nr:ABC transporter permease subunit [Methanomassiliicoccus sp.]